MFHWVCFSLASVRNCRVPGVVLGPSVLSGLVQRPHTRRLGHLRHNGSHSRIMGRRLPGVQGDRWPLRLDTYCVGIGRPGLDSLRVRFKTLWWTVWPQRKLHVHLAQVQFETDRRATRRPATSHTTTHQRCFYSLLKCSLILTEM